MFAPVHDAHHDGARFRGHFHQVEAGFFGRPTGFFDGDDADLFAIGTDETDWAQTDLLVDTRLRFDKRLPPG
jgi:hypothetical protein